MTKRCTTAACLSAVACGSPTAPTAAAPSGWNAPVAIADVTRCGRETLYVQRRSARS